MHPRRRRRLLMHLLFLVVSESSAEENTASGTPCILASMDAVSELALIAASIPVYPPVHADTERQEKYYQMAHPDPNTTVGFCFQATEKLEGWSARA
jgi:hypothetical protein